jgi:hypothetical protein
MSFVSVSHLHCCITYAQPVHHRRGVCWLHMLLLTADCAPTMSTERVHLAVALDRVCIFRARSARAQNTQHAYSSAYVRMQCAQRCGEAAGEQSVRCVRAPTRECILWLGLGNLDDWLFFWELSINLKTLNVHESWKMESIDTNLKSSKTVYITKNSLKDSETI